MDRDQALRHGVMFLLRERAMQDRSALIWDPSEGEDVTCLERGVRDGDQCGACEASFLMSQMVGEKDE